MRCPGEAIVRERLCLVHLNQLTTPNTKPLFDRKPSLSPSLLLTSVRDGSTGEAKGNEIDPGYGLALPSSLLQTDRSGYETDIERQAVSGSGRRPMRGCRWREADLRRHF